MTQPLAVLVVDDEPRSLETLRRTLDEDFAVFAAASAAEAEAVMEREFVHIVVSDQRMPGTSGVDFLKRARHGFDALTRASLRRPPPSGRRAWRRGFRGFRG